MHNTAWSSFPSIESPDDLRGFEAEFQLAGEKRFYSAVALGIKGLLDFYTFSLCELLPPQQGQGLMLDQDPMPQIFCSLNILV